MGNRYVSALHLPSHMPKTLISGGGDYHLYLWDYISGELKGQLEVWSHIRPLMVAESQRRKFQRTEVKAGSGWRARKKQEKEAREAREKEEREAKSESKLTAEKVAQLPTDVSDPNQETGSAADEATIFAAVDGPMGSIDTEAPKGTSATDSMGQTAAETSSLGKVNLPALEDVMVISKIDTLKFASAYAVIFTAVG